MIIQIDDQIHFEIYFDPLDREEGYDDDIRFAIHEIRSPNLPKKLNSDEIGILLTPTQAEQLAAALWAAADKSRNLPWPSRPKREAQAAGPFGSAYPRVTEFVKSQGRIELGQNANRTALLRAYDSDFEFWESKPDHKTVDQALLALEDNLAGFL